MCLCSAALCQEEVTPEGISRLLAAALANLGKLPEAKAEKRRAKVHRVLFKSNICFFNLFSIDYQRTPMLLSMMRLSNLFSYGLVQVLKAASILRQKWRLDELVS